MLPYVLLNEVEKTNNVLGSQLRAHRFAVEEEVEKLDADRVALNVESGALDSICQSQSPSLARFGFRNRGRGTRRGKGAGKQSYLCSSSWMPFTRFCAYATISEKRKAKLAWLSSDVLVRLMGRW